MPPNDTNDLPVVRTSGDDAIVRLEQWDDLIARLTLAEARLAAHHQSRYDTDCPSCAEVVAL